MVKEGEKAVIGMPCFSLAIERRDGKLFLSGMVPDGRGGFAAFWPGHTGAAVEPDAALAVLARAWPVVAGPFTEGGEPEGRFNLSSLVAGDMPEVVIDRKGVFSSVEADGRRSDLDTHSVVAVEVLMRLGEILASETADEALKAKWTAAVSRTLLTPFLTQIDFDRHVDGEEDRETEWHASQLGQSLGDYSLAARWLQARQLLYAVKGEGSDVPCDEWKASVLPEGLPGEAEVDALVARAAAAFGTSAEELARDAVYLRNSDARQMLVYSRWYGDPRGGTASLAAKP